MHRLRRSLNCALAFALCAATSLTFAAPNGSLDGKVFVADAGPKGKPANEKGDVITFADGQFHSKICDQWGYGRGAVTATQQGDAIAFEAETHSAKDGRLVWRGVVRGPVIEGGFVHYRKPSTLRPNPEPQEHWFKGAAKP